jgi:hypothetical protein
VIPGKSYLCLDIIILVLIFVHEERLGFPHGKGRDAQQVGELVGLVSELADGHLAQREWESFQMTSNDIFGIPHLGLTCGFKLLLSATHAITASMQL